MVEQDSDGGREHAHLAPATWLRRERVRMAGGALLGANDKVVDVGLLDPQNSYSDYNHQPKLECLKALIVYLQKPFVIYLYL